MPDTSKLEKLNRELEKSEKKLRKLYRFPERKVISVADRSPHYLEAMGR